MMPSALQQAGIDCLEFNSDSLGMEEIAGASIVRIHSLQDFQQISSDPFHLPEKTGQCSGSNPAALCLRPNEWLLISETAKPARLLNQTQGSIDPQRTAVYDNSDGLAIFRLSGSGAPWLLSKLSGLDYLTGTAAGEHCTRTKMGKVAVVVHYHQAGDDQFVFDLIFDRSIAKYLWDLLSESAPHADDLARAFGNAA
jgi:heterotetrameric sarcosine oxidase gamma subunit